MLRLEFKYDYITGNIMSAPIQVDHEQCFCLRPLYHNCNNYSFRRLAIMVPIYLPVNIPWFPMGGITPIEGGIWILPMRLTNLGIELMKGL